VTLPLKVPEVGVTVSHPGLLEATVHEQLAVMVNDDPEAVWTRLMELVLTVKEAASDEGSE